MFDGYLMMLARQELVEVGGLPSPEVWEEVRAVLTGEDSEGVSDRYAAQKVGVSVRDLKRWVARSREARPEDEDWVKEIAAVWDGRHSEQQGVLEDRLWESALIGVTKTETVTQDTPNGQVVTEKEKHEGGSFPAAVKLLEARGGMYAKKEVRDVNVTVKMDASEAFRRFKAQERLGEIGYQGEGFEGGELPAPAVEVEAAIPSGDDFDVDFEDL